MFKTTTTEKHSLKHTQNTEKRLEHFNFENYSPKEKSLSLRFS